MSKMLFNGVELEIDLMDADNMEMFENNLEKIAIDIKEPTQYDGKKASEQIRLQCDYVDSFFDDTFGDGTAEKLFGKTKNIAERLEAFGTAANLGNQTSEQAKDIMNKYAPERVQNRAQRRAQNKGKGKVRPYNNAANRK
ncbi:MAG: DUF6673 family protein [Blautia sp.]